MSNDDRLFLGLICCGVISGFLIGFLIRDTVNNRQWKAEIVKRGHAHYDMTTGAWTWNVDVKP